MASVYDLKPRFQALLRPLCTTMARVGITANQVTLFAMLLSILVGLTVYRWPAQRWLLFVIPICLFVRMALNAIDGMLAREFGHKSRLGAILNELGDVISDVALYLPLAVVPRVSQTFVVVFVVVAIVVEFTGVTALTVGSDRRYDGPMGKSDRAFWIGLLAVLLAVDVVSPLPIKVYLSLLIFLSFWTVINRANRALSFAAEDDHTDTQEKSKTRLNDEPYNDPANEC